MQFFKVIIALKKDTLQQSLAKRAGIFLLYLKFTFKDLWLTRFLKKKITSEIFLNYHIHFSSYPSFRNLFTEIFIFQQYRFITQKKDPYIVDAGANIGMSVLFFKFLYPHSRVIAFEPDEDVFALLKQNIHVNNLKDVTIYNVALLDKKGEISFYTNTSNDSVGTAIKEGLKSGEVLVKKVKSEQLSAFVDQEVDLLKIDVEGCEDVIMLELAEKEKLRLINSMIIEYHPYLCGKIKTLTDFLNFLKQGQWNCVFSNLGENYLVYANKTNHED